MQHPTQNTTMPTKVPDRTRVYAIGDIHGRIDLLDTLHDMILKDAQTSQGQKLMLIHLGDYVDRGHDSFGVVEKLTTFALENFEVINLKGNHEDFLLRFLSEETGEPSILDAWCLSGCIETFASYGVEAEFGDGLNQAVDRIREQFAKAIPAIHLKFFQNLNTRRTIGDYFFVHAGIRPGVPLNRQKKWRSPLDTR